MRLFNAFISFACLQAVFAEPSAVSVHGQVVVYEALGSYPEANGWSAEPFCAPERELQEGWLVQRVEVDCGGPPRGDYDAYRMPLDEFAEIDSFFFEWRLQTDGDRSEITGVAPAFLATGDLFGVSYHFTIASDRVRLIRDNRLPLVFVDLDPLMPHTYRLELIGAQSYAWFIDGILTDAGIPEGAYPTPTAVIAWGAEVWYQDNTSTWDFVRLGRIPGDASGDYDSDGAATLFDHYFVVDCLSKDGPGIFGGPGENAGPGCRVTDFDGDKDVDLLDFAEFQNLFGGPHP